MSLTTHGQQRNLVRCVSAALRSNCAILHEIISLLMQGWCGSVTLGVLLSFPKAAGGSEQKCRSSGSFMPNLEMPIVIW